VCPDASHPAESAQFLGSVEVSNVATQLEFFDSPMAIRVRLMAQSIWKNYWFGWVTILSFSIWYAWWCYHIPSPAKAATLLAVIAAIMAYRAEPEGFEKLFWTLVLFGFLFLELHAIDHKEILDAQERHSTQMEEQNNFRRIGTGITAGVQGILDESHEQFQATMEQFGATMKKSNEIYVGVHSLPNLIAAKNAALAEVLKRQGLPPDNVKLRAAVVAANILTYIADNPPPNYQYGTFAPDDKNAIYSQYSHKLSTGFIERFSPEAAAIYKTLEERGVQMPQWVKLRCQETPNHIGLNEHLMRQCAEDLIMYSGRVPD